MYEVLVVVPRYPGQPALPGRPVRAGRDLADGDHVYVPAHGLRARVTEVRPFGSRRQARLVALLPDDREEDLGWHWQHALVLAPPPFHEPGIPHPAPPPAAREFPHYKWEYRLNTAELREEREAERRDARHDEHGDKRKKEVA